MSEETGLGKIFSFLTFFQKDPDEVKIPIKVPNDSTIPQETGRDRLKRMFSFDEYGYQSKEMAFITQASSMSVLGGLVFGGISQSRDAYVNFIQNNEATKFANHLEAKRILQRSMVLAFAKGAYRWGWRIGLFTLSFSTLVTSISVYQDQESLSEYLIAGGITGGLFKMNMGLKGAIAGSVAGMFVGGVGGGLMLLLLNTSGVTLKELGAFVKTLKDARDEKVKENIQEHLRKEYTDFLENKDKSTPNLNSIPDKK